MNLEPQKACDILLMIANGVDPEQRCSVTELMLAARMGALALAGLSQVGTLAIKMAEAAVQATNAIADVAGVEKMEDAPVNRIILPGVNGDGA